MDNVANALEDRGIFTAQQGIGDLPRLDQEIALLRLPTVVVDIIARAKAGSFEQIGEIVGIDRTTGRQEDQRLVEI
uniref:hypothetical protein n=1 Tax=Streptomyces galilaeus TaxID=33899 RepID=UPI0038F79A74